MTSPEIKLVGGTLEVDEDLAFQRRQWRVQRIARVVMLVLVLAALAGLLGPGPLSGTSTADPTGALTVEYNRFERTSRQTELRVRVAPGQVRDGAVRLWVDAAHARELRLLSAMPPPAAAEVRADRQVYTFAAAAAAADAPVEVTIRYEHQAAGRARGRVGVVGGPAVEVNQFVYP